MTKKEQERLVKERRMKQRRRAKKKKLIRNLIKKTVRFLCVFVLLCILAKIGFAVNANAGALNFASAAADQISMIEAKTTAIKNEDNKAVNQHNEELIRQLEAMNGDQKADAILSNLDQYPDDVLDLYLKNPETLDFVLQYPNSKHEKKISPDLSVEDCTKQNGIPLFIQWDSRWGYCDYGDKMIAQAGCGPTCLSMVAVGLTGDTTLNPGVVSRFSEENGYLDGSNGTLWSLMTYGAQELGLSARELSLDEDVIIRALQAGSPIICSVRPGDFTTEGHFIVLCGYEDGTFIVNDPNSRINSEKRWTYSRLQPQIKNLWSFSL